jgi:diadenosine tetraphosphatase ApaH/serine/threonine PP2A family protein phosphatase
VRHAIVSDIHGNLEALEAVLEDIERRDVASIVCLGDFVGYGASPNECIETLRPRIELAVAGNHDLAACGRLRLNYFNPDAASAARWTDVQLTAQNRDYLRSLPFSVPWRGMLLVHSSPSSPTEWHYVLSPMDAEAEMDAFDESVCLIGHSHVAGAFEWNERRMRYMRDEEISLAKGCRYLVNVGSVGQPRDGDPRAAYLIFDETRRSLLHVRREYDVAGAMRRIVDAGLPRFLAERLQWGE